MRSNLTQIMQDTFQVSGTNDRVKQYGRAKESRVSGRQGWPRSSATLSTPSCRARRRSPLRTTRTARVMASYQAQIDAGNIVLTGSTATLISEANLLTLLQTIYTNGCRAQRHHGHPDQLADRRGLREGFGPHA
jgi:hypothetical protein